jgi:anti-anti-sigma factor
MMRAVHEERNSGIYVVTLGGALNVRRAGEARQLFEELARQGVRQVVVDMGAVPFIDGRGLAALIGGFKSFGSDARNFRMVGVQDQPRLVFELTGFDRVFQVETHARGEERVCMDVVQLMQSRLRTRSAASALPAPGRHWAA